MAWQSEATEVFRVMLLDLNDTPTYSDSILQRVLIVSAQTVLLEMDFSQDYVVDIGKMTITPDPTATSTRDNSFINLSCLKAACILDKGESRIAASKGFSIKDRDHAVDLRGITEARLALLEKGWCKTYDDAKLEYLAGQVRVAGAAVMTPFRIYAGYNDLGGYTAYEGRSVYHPFN